MNQMPQILARLKLGELDFPSDLSAANLIIH
jgi:hypothetical protein